VPNCRPSRRRRHRDWRLGRPRSLDAENGGQRGATSASWHPISSRWARDFRSIATPLESMNAASVRSSGTTSPGHGLALMGRANASGAVVEQLRAVVSEQQLRCRLISRISLPSDWDVCWSPCSHERCTAPRCVRSASDTARQARGGLGCPGTGWPGERVCGRCGHPGEDERGHEASRQPDSEYQDLC
jgi:hypothetical protein